MEIPDGVLDYRLLTARISGGVVYWMHWSILTEWLDWIRFTNRRRAWSTPESNLFPLLQLFQGNNVQWLQSSVYAGGLPQPSVSLSEALQQICLHKQRERKHLLNRAPSCSIFLHNRSKVSCAAFKVPHPRDRLFSTYFGAFLIIFGLKTTF